MRRTLSGVCSQEVHVRRGRPLQRSKLPRRRDFHNPATDAAETLLHPAPLLGPLLAPTSHLVAAHLLLSGVHSRTGHHAGRLRPVESRPGPPSSMGLAATRWKASSLGQLKHVGFISRLKRTPTISKSARPQSSNASQLKPFLLLSTNSLAVVPECGPAHRHTSPSLVRHHRSGRRLPLCLGSCQCPTQRNRRLGPRKS